MEQIHLSGCVLCAQNCGLELTVRDNRIVRVRGDRGNLRSQGYCCRKGMQVAWHQHHGDRLRHPLKRIGDRFEQITWNQALDEIATRMRDLVDRHGPRCLAYMGGGGQGSHFEAAFGVRLLRAMGSRYHYSPLAQEFSGMFWTHGRMFGRQYLHLVPDIDRTDLLLVIGWNGMESHQIPQAPRHLLRIAKDPSKLLVVIDPRASRTARIADRHLAIRPGTDALLLKAMIAIILAEGWQDDAFLQQHTAGFPEIAPLFAGFDFRAAIRTCGLDLSQVRELCRLFATRRSCLRYDLGVMMNRHSAAASYLAVILQALCGRIGVPGGAVLPGHLLPIGSHSDERSAGTWHTVATGFFPVAGTYPPNAMPEEILSDHPERLRAVLVSGANPLRSYADTTAYEKAFRRLDLAVTVDLAMTETAALSHYVLPARSGYASWDGTFFAHTYPEIFFQLRRPILEEEGEPLETGEIHLRLADRLGLIPPIPEELTQAAAGDRGRFALALAEYAKRERRALPMMPFILGKTLGKALGSVHLAALWGLLQATPRSFVEAAERVGHEPGANLRENLFDQLVEQPQGCWLGAVDPANNLGQLRTEDGRIHLQIEELEETVRSLEAKSEEAALTVDPAYPFILMAGRHADINANTLMRDPGWNGSRRTCTLAIHPADAAGLGVTDGQMIRVTTEAGSELIECEISPEAGRGHVVIPHGFGLVHEGRAHGVNVNRLTKNTHRDFLGTPMHRYVPCRLEPA